MSIPMRSIFLFSSFLLLNCPFVNSSLNQKIDSFIPTFVTINDDNKLTANHTNIINNTNLNNTNSTIYATSNDTNSTAVNINIFQQFLICFCCFFFILIISGLGLFLTRKHSDYETNNNLMLNANESTLNDGSIYGNSPNGVYTLSAESTINNKKSSDLLTDHTSIDIPKLSSTTSLKPSSKRLSKIFLKNSSDTKKYFTHHNNNNHDNFLKQMFNSTYHKTKQEKKSLPAILTEPQKIYQLEKVKFQIKNSSSLFDDLGGDFIFKKDVIMKQPPSLRQNSLESKASTTSYLIVGMKEEEMKFAGLREEGDSLLNFKVIDDSVEGSIRKCKETSASVKDRNVNFINNTNSTRTSLTSMDSYDSYSQYL
ncbi:hypothetical protein HDU92_003290 [Lobulomyces angularis]|nr:hypothetical protein HDU92_003290 [Lobulomyces angularis]